MPHRLASLTVRCALVLLILVALEGCRSVPRPAPEPAGPPLRFLLTFDDGPSIASKRNPTEQVLRTLGSNPVQPGIKAIFFVQTRASKGGGTPQGRELIRRGLAQGQVLGFHTASPGHSNHLGMESGVLRSSLQLGLADHAELGSQPRLVRPPMWAYDDRTLSVYAEFGLRALLTDVTANDGKLIPPYGSPRRRQHMDYQMDLLRPRVLAGELPLVQGVIPVVVTFHDPNPFTAEHLAEYLQILVKSARQQGLRVSEQPFYGQGDDIEAVALARTVAVGQPVQRIPGFWHSLLRMKP
ncbi:polysaccharide deacetylase family protein [Pelomonas sp. V22]|uniref:polysaccharide deacetylase family protein n=1 Tax=Pelomonas sp. V22 TaxID=2822139 RepID=UPI0024A7D655|nr:polysaccharide deacetylase family protein [Pelomonas sp. V22]MDI4635493.1 polysaccharide deacetylase family protein [Pelomonas sp. V22]